MTNRLTIKIMLIDDDLFTLKIIRSMLRKSGYVNISTYDNGHEALKVMDNPELCPDLILLDLNMPEMDGAEVLRYLVEYRYKGKLIIFSGEDEQTMWAVEQLVLAHKIPLLGYVRKPIITDLEGLIEKWTPAPDSTQAPGVDSRTEETHFIKSNSELINTFSPQISHLAAPEMGVADLQTALANNELLNYYQPKVSTITGKVVGVEALARLNHSKSGMVLPAMFIGVAEAHGLSREVTRRVLTDALAQLKTWHQAGLTLQLSVNVSLDSLTSLDFVDFISHLVADAGVQPNKVTVEISERAANIIDMRAPLEALVRLRLRRFRVAIDELSSDNSCLTLLRGMPSDQLKIDRSFVNQASIDTEVRAKYDACLLKAKELGIEVVAVGVAEKSDWNLLHSSGCDFAQGYFIAEPMPAAELPGWIQAWKSRAIHLI